jgi:hypothetical protein
MSKASNIQQRKDVQVLMLGFSLVGIGFSIRRLANNRKNTDKLEQAAEVLGLLASIVAFIAAVRKMRKGD